MNRIYAAKKAKQHVYKHTHTTPLISVKSQLLSTQGKIQVTPHYEACSDSLPHAESKAGLNPWKGVQL